MNRKELFETIYHASFTTLSKYFLMKTGHVQDAQDLLQDMYLDFYKMIINTDTPIENPIAYLKTMANHSLSKYYASKDQISTLKMDSDNFFEQIEDPLDLEISVLDKIDVETIWSYVEAMNEPVKTFILLRYRFNLNYREISEGMNIPESTVKSALYRALKEIKEKYNQSSSKSEKSSSSKVKGRM